MSFHLAPSPYQAFGEAGRSHHGPNRSCATGDRAAAPQDVAAPVDMREGRCESPEGQSVNRPSVSISHSSTVLSRERRGTGEARCVREPKKTPTMDSTSIASERPVAYGIYFRPSRSSSRNQRRASRARVPVGLGCSLVYFRNQSSNSSLSKDATARLNNRSRWTALRAFPPASGVVMSRPARR